MLWLILILAELGVETVKEARNKRREKKRRRKEVDVAPPPPYELPPSYEETLPAYA